jgi:CheY-like chemotaxis protein
MTNALAYIRPVPDQDVDAPAPREEPVRVLIVEDEEESAHSLSTLLRMDGFSVARAPDGPTALGTARSGMIDAIVLDVRLPGLSGFEVCQRLRQDPATAGLTIVMLTGLDDTQSKIDGLDHGADDYLVKPVASRELGARLRHLMAARQARAREVERERQAAAHEAAATIGQDVRRPLTAALGSVDLLLLARTLPPDVRHELRECQRQLVQIGRALNARAASEGQASGSDEA